MTKMMTLSERRESGRRWNEMDEDERESSENDDLAKRLDHFDATVASLSVIAALLAIMVVMSILTA